jgi:hypothetical protein
MRWECSKQQHVKIQRWHTRVANMHMDSSLEDHLTTLLPFVLPSRSGDDIDIEVIDILTQNALIHVFSDVPDLLALLSRVGHLHDRRCHWHPSLR